MPTTPRRGLLPRRTAIALALASLTTVAGPAAASPSGSSAAVTTGLQAVARAQVWVTKDVPYSQSATFDGYRTDCSGYISMAWGLTRPGLTTYSLRRVGDFITKPQLRRGDLLLSPTTHVVLFEKWADAERTHYWGYEESSSHGAVYRKIPYPYWPGYGQFRPFHKRGMTPS